MVCNISDFSNFTSQDHFHAKQAEWLELRRIDLLLHKLKKSGSTNHVLIERLKAQETEIKQRRAIRKEAKRLAKGQAAR